jgi:hypothetical protein
MGDPVTTAATVSAGGNLAGGILDKTIQDPQKEVSVVKTYPPGYEDFRARLLGILDAGIKERGYDKYIPAERMPYELRSPEERAQIQSNFAGLTDDQKDQANYGARPEFNAPPNAQYNYDAPMAENAAEAAKDGEGEALRGPSEEELQKTRLASAIQARRMNVGQQKPIFMADRLGTDMSNEAAQQPVNDIWNFIHGGRIGTRNYSGMRG